MALMKNIKNELQDLVLGNESIGHSESVKKAQIFLRRYAQANTNTSKEKHFKNQEEEALSDFLEEKGWDYQRPISQKNYLTEGAEQKVYHLNEQFVIKLNDGIFYETWLDYFNSLLIHNYFFPVTHYEFLGFSKRNNRFFAIVKQRYIPGTEVVDLKSVKIFLEANGFENIRNHDYFSQNLGIIFEDLHDENIISNNGILYFIDTIFYLTEDFYKP